MISHEWQYPGHSGALWTVSVSYGCSATYSDIDWQLGENLGWWNDRISSRQAYASCGVKYWGHAGFGGANYGWTCGVIRWPIVKLPWL